MDTLGPRDRDVSLGVYSLDRTFLLYQERKDGQLISLKGPASFANHLCSMSSTLLTCKRDWESFGPPRTILHLPG